MLLAASVHQVLLCTFVFSLQVKQLNMSTTVCVYSNWFKDVPALLQNGFNEPIAQGLTVSRS